MKKYEIQFIENILAIAQQIPGINIPKINGVTSVYGTGGSSAGTKATGKLFVGSLQGIDNATVTLVNMDSEEFSEGVTVDTANKKITILTDGYYLINGQLSWDTTTADTKYWTYISKNGSTIRQSVVQASMASSLSVQVNDILHLVAGDYIQISCYQDSGGPKYIRAGADDSSFTICKI